MCCQHDSNTRPNHETSATSSFATNWSLYMNALERPSVGEDIIPFSDFINDLVRKGLAGEPLPAVRESS